MNADGTGARRVAVNGRNPDWSPDGSKLAYDNGNGAVVVSDATSGNAQTVLKGADPAWSPDGSRLALARQQAILVAAPDGSGERIVTTGAVEPDWSPDGTKLVFTRTDKDNPGLAIIGVDGSGARSLTSTEDRQPAWSPDGRTIAYAHCSPASGLGCAYQIFVVAPDGTGRRARTPADAEAVQLAPSWAPDSQRLVFARFRSWQDDGDSHIVTGSRRLTHTPAPRTPILVRSHSGRPLATINPGGEAVSLAVTRTLTAALVRRNTWRLEIYSPKRRIVNLGKRRVASTLAASGRRVAFQAGRSIFVIDARSGRLRLVARAAGTPIGLSIVGRRIAWAENLRGGARVRAITLR
jgi:dipeptidyl aminopeptidase/acylaminoacyl peptidase